MDTLRSLLQFLESFKNQEPSSTALLPHSAGIGSYLNGEAEFPEERVRHSYGAKYERLGRIKQTYDPHNLFHLNANIPPSAGPESQDVLRAHSDPEASTVPPPLG